MDRQFYLDLAASGLRMPIGTHLVLHEEPDPGAIMMDGRQLGRVVAQAAKRFRIPLALPLMDLQLEKEALLLARGVAAAEVDTFHFTELPETDAGFQLTAPMVAVCDAICHIASETDLVPVGMGIGPFSLMTKLLSDPITPVFLAGAGATTADDPEVALVERLLELSFLTIQTYLEDQMDAGAKAIILCEPAANKVFFSPNQLAVSYDIFDRYVMHWNQGYGNLPTKQFYSDELVSVSRVRQLSDDLLRRMREVGHPFILGSECDILSVPGREQTLKAKVEAFLGA